MFRHIYRTVHAPKGILKATWNCVSGNDILRNRGMWPNYNLQKGGAFLCGFASIVPGIALGDHFNSFLLGAATVAAAASAPTLLLHLPYAIYKAGEHDNHRFQIEQEQKKRIEAQQRKALPSPHHNLI
jgi:hypothetical protein